MSPSKYVSFLLIAFSQPTLAYYLFQSKYPAVEPVIKECRIEWPQEKSMCGQLMRCIIDNVPSDYPARWSAGASILAFIPTIAALMSNSIDEVTAIAEESIFLALAISLSSVTVFSSRLGDRVTSTKLGFHDASAEYMQTTRNSIFELLNDNTQKYSRMWHDTRLQDAVIGSFMIGISALIWWQLFLVTRYGIVTFACPVKVNVMLWAALSQGLTLLNVSLRHLSFNHRKIYLNPPYSQARRTLSEPMIESPEIDNQGANIVIVLRCPRSTWQRRLLQMFTAVLSCSIYTFGTIVLASITLFEAADALRVVVVVAVNAGFGRMVGYWALSSIRKGKKAILIDVPAAHIEKLSEMIHEEF